MAMLVIGQTYYGSVSGQKCSRGACPEFPPFKQFDLKRYEGTWFEDERSFFLFEEHINCIRSDFSINDDETLQEVDTGYFDNHHKISWHDNGTNFFVDGQRPAKMVLMFQAYPYSIPYELVSTDYDSWSVVYQCKEHTLPLLGLMHSEILWTGIRDRNATDDVRAKIHAAIDAVGLDRSSLKRINQTGCPN